MANGNVTPAATSYGSMGRAAGGIIAPGATVAQTVTVTPPTDSNGNTPPYRRVRLSATPITGEAVGTGTPIHYFQLEQSGAPLVPSALAASLPGIALTSTGAAVDIVWTLKNAAVAGDLATGWGAYWRLEWFL